jgi:hypothetical protein
MPKKEWNMGHDGYLFALPLEKVGDRQTMNMEAWRELGIADDELLRQEIWGWRRYYAIADWMAQLYVEKGGVLKEEVGFYFNNKFVRLLASDMDRLDEDIRAGKIDDSDFPAVATLEKVIPVARSAIKAGKAVFYYCSY